VPINRITDWVSSRLRTAALTNDCRFAVHEKGKASAEYVTSDRLLNPSLLSDRSSALGSSDHVLVHVNGESLARKMNASLLPTPTYAYPQVWQDALDVQVVSTSTESTLGYLSLSVDVGGVLLVQVFNDAQLQTDASYGGTYVYTGRLYIGGTLAVSSRMVEFYSQNGIAVKQRTSSAIFFSGAISAGSETITFKAQGYDPSGANGSFYSYGGRLVVTVLPYASWES